MMTAFVMGGAARMIGALSPLESTGGNMDESKHNRGGAIAYLLLALVIVVIVVIVAGMGAR